jgi:stage V sporulation protein AA
MAANQDTLYIKGDRNVEIQHRDVTLSDLVSMECSNKQLLPRLKTMKILKIGEQHRVVVSILKLIDCVHQQYPDLDIQNMGEADIIVTYEDQQTPAKWIHLLKVACITVITFFGAAFSIMAFNNDVSATGLFAQIYEMVTGSPSDGYSILEVTYSVGIAVGILVFFNHFGKRKFSVDPTPMEVQMRLYENDIQTTLVENAARRGQEYDVDHEPSHSSNHRSQ